MSERQAHLRLRKYLDRSEQAVWPSGFRPAELGTIDPRQAHAVLDSAFPGLVAPLADWHANLIQDSEYDPSLCIAAISADGMVVGFVQCWTSNFVKDLAVAPAHRGQGIGAALMREVFTRFAARGSTHVDLKVLTEETTARRLYARLGMVEVME